MSKQKIEALKDNKNYKKCKNGKEESKMAYQSRKPSSKLILDKELFNQLISILDKNIQVGVNEESFSILAERLKNKLLTYSVPRTDEEGICYVDIRFFPNEASDMIWQLLIQTEKNETVEDYYSALIKNRENK